MSYWTEKKVEFVPNYDGRIGISVKATRESRGRKYGEQISVMLTTEQLMATLEPVMVKAKAIQDIGRPSVQ
jgi:hypothetical protein